MNALETSILPKGDGYVFPTLLATLITGFSAFDFTNSVCENLHIDSNAGQWQNYDYIEGFLNAEHIGCVRTSLTIYPGANNRYVNFMNKLNADLGITSIEIAGMSITSMNQVAPLVAMRKGISYIEGPNEPDISGDPNWIAKTEATEWSLAAYHLTNPSISIVAPAISMANPASVQPINPSSISAPTLLTYPFFQFQYGNMHPYTGKRPPETSGWGGPVYGATYGSLAYNIAAASQLSGSLPVIATEAGFSTADVTEATQSAYLQRLILWTFMNGVKKTALYDFTDDSQSYGLSRVDGSMKPAAYGLQGLRDTLYDAKPFKGTCALNAAVATKAAYKSLLLCKSNGEEDLVLWQPTQLQNPDTGAATPTTPADLSVSATGVSGKTLIYLETPASRMTVQAAPRRGAISGSLTEFPLVIAFHAGPRPTFDALPVVGTGLINGKPIPPGTAKISPTS